MATEKLRLGNAGRCGIAVLIATIGLFAAEYVRLRWLAYWIDYDREVVLWYVLGDCGSDTAYGLVRFAASRLPWALLGIGLYVLGSHLTRAWGAKRSAAIGGDDDAGPAGDEE